MPSHDRDSEAMRCTVADVVLPLTSECNDARLMSYPCSPRCAGERHACDAAYHHDDEVMCQHARAPTKTIVATLCGFLSSCCSDKFDGVGWIVRWSSVVTMQAWVHFLF